MEEFLFSGTEQSGAVKGTDWPVPEPDCVNLLKKHTGIRPDHCGLSAFSRGRSVAGTYALFLGNRFAGDTGAGWDGGRKDIIASDRGGFPNLIPNDIL
jgi:hypothetical protein